MIRRGILTVMVACTVLLGLPSAALADTVVPAGQTVVEVTVIGEDVTLNGTSAGSVIVIDGNLTVGPHGRAEHGVTVIGGRLVTTQGARIHGDVLQLLGPIPHPSGWALAAIATTLLALRGLLVWLLVRVSRILAAWPSTATMLSASRRRPLRSGIVGALLTAGLLAAGILLALSVVGLVFTAALAGILLLAACLGVAFALRAVSQSRAQTRTLIAALIIPVIGDALLTLATIAATGAAFHYLVDERGNQPSAVPTRP